MIHANGNPCLLVEKCPDVIPLENTKKTIPERVAKSACLREKECRLTRVREIGLNKQPYLFFTSFHWPRVIQVSSYRVLIARHFAKVSDTSASASYNVLDVARTPGAMCANVHHARSARADAYQERRARMQQIIPRQYYFRAALACGYLSRRANLAATGERLALPASYRLFFPGEFDSQLEFGDVRLAWNEAGLYLQWHVSAKRHVLYGEAERPQAGDGLALWLDMRDTRTIHRASRYCQHWLLLAHDGGNPPTPKAISRKIHRALEDAPAVKAELVISRLYRIDKNGLWSIYEKGSITQYGMEVFLPAAVLPGFDPDNCPRMGITYRLRDRELGDQLLSAGKEFPYEEDPSLWSVLELTR